VYRSASAVAAQDVALRLAPGARLEWVPDHTIPFAGAAYRQTLTAEVGDGGAVVIVDAFAAGRVARAETWRFALLDSTLSIRDARGRLLHERLTLRDGRPRGLGITEDRPYFATIVVVADAGLHAFGERVAAVDIDAEIGVASLPRRGVMVRCLTMDAPALGAAIEAVWTAARVEVLGAPPLALRKP
jgi:urease accessory protein